MPRKTKEKTDARTLQEATGKSYQTCLNALRNNGGDYEKAFLELGGERNEKE